MFVRKTEINQKRAENSRRLKEKLAKREARSKT
jgi:hypothetical protein